jgi:DNA gyrase subunit A
MAEEGKIIDINIENEMKTAYIDYSMSVIVSRALPDVRDGMKPVHRRVLFGMHELGMGPTRPYKKSARIVGEVLGKYHPHGDSSVYDTMVRMAQDWSLRYCLVDGQGNYGSVDGDPPAAMRYTEARMTRIAEEMLSDIEKDTVDMQLNFDDTLEEPRVLPSRFPNLLVNGAAGIAVGMATNMAPHNLSEVIDGICAYIDNREITSEELLPLIKAPDFPTGGIIYGYEGVRDAMLTGRGRVVIRSKSEIEEINNRERIIITEIPYQVNKSDLLVRIGELVNEKKIEGISDVRDESSKREGMRIVIEVKRDASASVILNSLYKYSNLQTSFSINNIALVKGRPMALNVRDMIEHFVEHRHDVIVRRTQFDLKEAQKRAHILEGLLIALDHLDEVIALIRNSPNPDEARAGLMERFGLSEIQARAILDMRLQRLTGLERDKIRDEYNELMKTIADLEDILANEPRRYQIIKDEQLLIKEKYGDERRSEIDYAGGDMNMEDLIADEEVVVTISHQGYIKRTALLEYRKQGRGGRGVKGSSTKDEDFVENVLVASNHNYLLVFTKLGRCFWLRVFNIPETGKVSKGRAIQNIIQLPPEDKVMAYLPVKSLSDKEYIENTNILFCTKNGIIKKTTLEDFSRPRANGIIALGIREGDELLAVNLTTGSSEVLIAIRSGRSIRFPESKVRAMGRTATGVIGIELDDEKDEVVGMICVNNPEATIFVLSENGYGKRSELDEYRITNRGGKGVKAMQVTEKTGRLVSIQEVSDFDDLIVIRKDGVAIRIGMMEFRVMGRATQGVKVIRLEDGASIASVAKIARTQEEYEREIAEAASEAAGENLNNESSEGSTNDENNETQHDA